MKKILLTFLFAGVIGFASAASNTADESSVNALRETVVVTSSLANAEIPEAQQNLHAVAQADFFDCRVEGTVTFTDKNGNSYTVRFIIIFKDVSCAELIKEVLK